MANLKTRHFPVKKIGEIATITQKLSAIPQFKLRKSDYDIRLIRCTAAWNGLSVIDTGDSRLEQRSSPHIHSRRRGFPGWQTPGDLVRGLISLARTGHLGVQSGSYPGRTTSCIHNDF